GSTKEEVKQYKNYLVWAKKILLLILVVICLYFLKFNLLSLILFIFGFIFGFIFRSRYFYLGFLLALSFLISKEVMLLIASIILIYGIFYGSLSKKWITINFILFLIPFLLLLFNINYEPFLAFVAGALFLKE
ncbi:MAG: hypothetical protein NT139_01040, partial [Candidatus Woesearchaeota archaeon]|nr:hypothetical protein [Candidatus Woesearchaeota archaeon]